MPPSCLRGAASSESKAVRALSVAFGFLSVHSDKSSVLAAEAPLINGDETRPRLYDQCPEAFDRLEIFQWEWYSDRDANDRAWVRSRGMPISVEEGVNEDGLLEAAQTVATVVQHALHHCRSPIEPLERFDLWHARLGYLTRPSTSTSGGTSSPSASTLRLPQTVNHSPSVSAVRTTSRSRRGRGTVSPVTRSADLAGAGALFRTRLTGLVGDGRVGALNAAPPSPTPRVRPRPS